MPGEPGTAHPDVLRAQLAAAYLKLAALQLNFHARDFWRMRAASRRIPGTDKLPIHCVARSRRDPTAGLHARHRAELGSFESGNLAALNVHYLER
jgi:hypothetical protein